MTNSCRATVTPRLRSAQSGAPEVFYRQRNETERGPEEFHRHNTCRTPNRVREKRVSGTFPPLEGGGGGLTQSCALWRTPWCIPYRPVRVRGARSAAKWQPGGWLHPCSGEVRSLPLSRFCPTRPRGGEREGGSTLYGSLSLKSESHPCTLRVDESRGGWGGDGVADAVRRRM